MTIALICLQTKLAARQQDSEERNFLYEKKILCERNDKRCLNNFPNAATGVTFSLRREYTCMQWKEVKEDVRISHPTDFYPKKMILKQGAKHFLLDTKDIVYCYSRNKVVYIVDANNQKFISDKSLLRLEAELDPRSFFKANRTQIINFHFIRSFVTHERSKMKVEMKALTKEQAVVISQTRVNAFRQWIYQQL
ncbi:MAG TPA: LytTR family DNA-binding domain-containing protein [Flavisolibacter sp.]|jgi:DNA-binding LytR/AlgR family response regulator|nr:LytTR family DNA-binding domain-containing protein [Flavisolibacter sp.]